jgi:hypothetical protein
MYQIIVTSFQERQWVVGCERYHIVGDSLTHNFQETILTPRTRGFAVKILKQEHEINDTQPLSSIKPSSYVFIELYDPSLGDDLKPHFSSMMSPKLISQSGSLHPQFPSSRPFFALSS